MAVNDPAAGPGDEDLPFVEPVEGSFRADVPRPAQDLEALPEVLPVTEIPRLQRPRPPHPNFWWALLWCLGFLFVTQLIPGILVAVPVVVIELTRSPNPTDLLAPPQKSKEEQAALVASAGAALKTTLLPELSKQKQAGTLNALNDKILPPAIFLSQLFVILFSLLILRLVVGREWTRQIALRRPALKHVVLALMAFPALMLLGGLVGELAKRVLPGFHDAGVDVESMIQGMRNLPLSFLILCIGVGPGIGEELWFRGFLGRGLVGRYGVVLGVLFTSFYFGAAHVDPPQAVGAAVLGVGLHLAYLASRSLWIPMLLHFLNNSLAVLALTQSEQPALKAVNETPTDALNPMTWLMYLAALILLAAAGWAFYQSRARVVPQEEAEHPWQPAYPGVTWPPPHSGAVVVSPWPSATALALTVVAFLALLFLMFQPLLFPG